MFEAVIFGLSVAHWLVVLSMGLGVFGGYSYVRDTLKGITKPNRVSWGIIAAIPLLGIAASLDAGADPWAVARVVLAGLIPLAIFLASFVNRNAYWQLRVFDYFCGALAVCALGFWFFAGNPIVAIMLLISADFLASLPTVKKAWQHPETETGVTFIMGMVSMIIVLPSVHTWDVANTAFPLFVLGINALLALGVYRKRIFIWLTSK